MAAVAIGELGFLDFVRDPDTMVSQNFVEYFFLEFGRIGGSQNPMLSKFP